MRGATVCSGIGAPEVAAPWVDWRWCSEIEAFPSAVLKHHRPHVPNRGDMTRFQEWPDDPIDILVGGTPCQSFSVAGLRGGMADSRGNLALVYLAIAARHRPRWIVWENVPGVLSSNGGRDFGSLLGGMAELGYGVAYRVLDAQFVRTCNFPGAVPQRRRRVFVVGHLGDWRRAAAVLFDRESLSGHPPPRREAGQGVAPTIAARTRGGGGLGTDFDCDGGLIASTGDVAHCQDVAPTLNAHFGDKQGLEDQHINGGGGMFVAFNANAQAAQLPSAGRDTSINDGLTCSQQGAVAFDLRGRDGGAMPEGPHDTANIRAASGGSSRSYVAHPHAVAFTQNSRSEVRMIGGDGSVTGALAADVGAQQQNYVAQPWAVRRLTPTECERLQGFPDGYTDIPYRGKRAADGSRYKVLGNTWAVNVGEWIFDRIRLVDGMAPEAAE